MTYLRAALFGLVAALVLGAIAGVHGVVRSPNPERKAEACAIGVTTGLNSAALFAVLLVPASVAGVFLKRRMTK